MNMLTLSILWIHWLSEENIYKQLHFVPQRRFLEDGRGKVAVDFIGRFERLEKDFGVIKERFNVAATLEKRKVGIKVDYRDVYTSFSREKIALLYKQDIDEFGYEF